jgi:hypothetical protein
VRAGTAGPVFEERGPESVSRVAAAGVGAFGGWVRAPRPVGGGSGIFCSRPLLAALSALAALLVLTGSASAGIRHPLVGSFAAGSSPQGVAVDQASGDVLVIDVNAGAVLKFDASGNPASFSALGSNSLGGFAFDQPSAAQVAVDNSGGPTDGYIYVASLSGALDVFDSTGTQVGSIDGSAASPQNGGELCGVAIDPAGNVYASYFSGHVDKYSPTDANPADDAFVGQLESVGRPCVVAADGLGNVYVSQWPNGPVSRYDSSQINQATPTGSVVDQASTALAIDPSTNDVLVDEGDRVAEFTSAGDPNGLSGAGDLSGNSDGVGIDGATGDLYAADDSVPAVLHFGPGVDVPAPVVTIDPPSSITSTSATFSGTVNPNGTDPLEDASWHFEYSTDGGATWTSTTGGDVGTGTSPVPVSDSVSQFLPDQAVQVRLVASNAANRVNSSVESFTTVALPPDVATERAQDITPTHAVLNATLNAHNAPTTYFFEIGPTTAYGTSVPATQDGDGGSSPNTILVIKALYDLQPDATYHYRIVAHNLAGTTMGADQTFTTTHPLPASAPRLGIPGTGVLPDDRGWEQASPPNKHGADVLIDSGRTRAAATDMPQDPMAATFSSLGTFADVHGTGIANDYMTIRTAQPGTNGWTTHGITAPQQPLTFFDATHGFESEWESEFSPDLSRGVFRSLTPLTSDPNVNGVENLYLRDDLRTPGAGSYQLLTACPLCASPLPAIAFSAEVARPAGASGDFGHVIFESTYPLVAGSTANPIPPNANPNLYEWDHGMLRLVGILPDSACGTPPCVAPTSLAGVGTGAGFGGGLRVSPHPISADGSRIIFTDPSSGFSGLDGKLYMRIDGTSTIQLNASERTDCADHDPCAGTPELDPNGVQPARFQTASSDGTRAFFTTSQQLTDTHTTGNGNLYMYDTTAPGPHLTLISAGHNTEDTPADVKGVLGASDDGQYVYFDAVGQLVAGQPVLGAGLGLYEWHDGVTTFITKLEKGPDELGNPLPNFWGSGPIVARVTPDGKHLLFQSSNNVEGYPANGHAELYLYNGDTHELQCASCRADGTPAGGDATDMSRNFEGGTGTSSHLSHALTDDGSRVFFTTTDRLVSQDANGKSDAYEFDSTTGAVHLLSGGTDNADSYFMDASANGNDAFFLTRQPLVGWDTDQNYDLYDARVDGGLPNPPAETQPSQRPLAVGLPVVVPGSQTLHSGGNLKPPARHGRLGRKPAKCRRGFVRKRVRGKVRCVRKPKPHRHVRRAVRARQRKGR